MKTETTNAITSLLVVNHHRQMGYHKAAQTTSHEDLKMLFNYLSWQSHAFNEELKGCVKKIEPAAELSVLAELNGTDAEILQNDRDQLLSAFEFKEDAVKRTYDNVMEHTESIAAELYEIMSRQRTEIHRSHSTVRSLYFNF